MVLVSVDSSEITVIYTGMENIQPPIIYYETSDNSWHTIKTISTVNGKAYAFFGQLLFMQQTGAKTGGGGKFDISFYNKSGAMASGGFTAPSEIRALLSGNDLLIQVNGNSSETTKFAIQYTLLEL